MRVYPKVKRGTETLISKENEWSKAVNELVSNTQVKPNEVADMYNCQLVEDGKIQCPRDGQAYFGNEDGSRVTGIFPFYLSDGTKQLIRFSGTKLQKYNTTTSDWDDISGKTYTSDAIMEGITAYDELYLVNGEDRLTKYDGTDIETYTEISAPGTPTVTRTAGSAGSYTFSYKITAVTSVGETTPSAAGEQTLDQDSLDDSNYMTVTWSAVTNAIGYNVYGRKDGRWYFLKYLDGNASTEFVDKGALDPSTIFTPPEGNSTGGPLGRYIALYKDTLFILGDPNNPSRLYYSGGGDKIDDFTLESGGGFIDISKNDGQLGTGIRVFKDSLLVFKEDSLYKFDFSTSGLPQVEQVNPSIGCIAPRSIVAVENDIFFMSRFGVYTVGNEAGFAFDVLRTNELSSKVRPTISDIDGEYIDNVCAVYAKKQNYNLVIFAYTPSGSTTNSKAIVYDRERLSWYKWDNINANCWATYIDSSGDVRILYGDDSSGYVKEILTGSDDFGTPIRGYVKMGAEDFAKNNKDSNLTTYKTLKNIFLTLRNPRGTIRFRLIKDGVSTVYTANLSTVYPSVNFGHYVMSEFLLGESTGSGVSEQDNNIVRRLRNINLVGRSFQVELDNEGNTGASFTLLEKVMEAKPKSTHYYGDGEVVT